MIKALVLTKGLALFYYHPPKRKSPEPLQPEAEREAVLPLFILLFFQMLFVSFGFSYYYTSQGKQSDQVRDSH